MPRARDHAERMRDEGRVVAAFLQARVEIVGDVVVGFEVGGRIPRPGADLVHRLLQVEPPEHCVRGANVCLLRRLVAAAEQDHPDRRAPDVVDAIAGAVVDTHLDDREPADFQSPGLPIDRRSMRAWIRRRATRSCRPANHVSKTSVVLMLYVGAL
jgi:hypothetical protein